MRFNKEGNYFRGKLINKFDYDCASEISGLGIPHKECEIIVSTLRQKRAPHHVIDTVVENAEKLTEIHPDTFPWPASLHDDICDSMALASINTDSVWNYVVRYAQRRYGKESIARCALKQGSETALTNLLESYALIRYNKIDELSGRKAIRF